MSSTLTTQESALQFHFYGNDRLYTDHHGRRVVADVEGSGTMHLLNAGPGVLSIRCDEQPTRFTSQFSNGSLVFALGPGDVSILVSKGRSDLVVGTPVECEGKYQGAGWVVEACHPFKIDERAEFSPCPTKDFAVPFFREVDCPFPYYVILDSSSICERVDAISIADAEGLRSRNFKVQNMSAISELESEFPDGTPFKGLVASHLNAASFSLSIPEDNKGLILRKLYDRFHGRQRARVLVDGIFAGWWYEPGECRQQRWHFSEFGIAEGLTRAKSEIRLTIDPPAGVALWSVSCLEVFALRAVQPKAE